VRQRAECRYRTASGSEGDKDSSFDLDESVHQKGVLIIIC